MDQAATKERDAQEQVLRFGALRAFCLFVLLDLGFHLFDFDRMNRFLMRWTVPRQSKAATDTLEMAQATFQAVQRATMLYYRRRKDCLPKALTTFHLLRRQGVSATLCFGVKKFPFEAHSWVESHGEILDDFPPRVSHYQVIHRIAS